MIGRRGPVLLILAALVALGPLSTDVYVPGLPELAEDLGTSSSAVQLTVTTCLIGLALGQLIAGPLSDSVGRRRPLLFGLTLYTVAGLLCAVVPNVTALVLLRAAQGLGGAFAVVIAYAYVRDRYRGDQAARYFSLMLSVTGLAPVLAPLAGAAILDVAGWREIFLILGVVSGLVLLAVARALPESHSPQSRTAGPVYRELLKDRVLLGYTLTNALVFAAMFAYIAGSPFVLEDLHGLSAQQYSLVFAVNGAGIMVAAQTSGRLLGSFTPHALLSAGVVTSLLGALGLVGLAATGAGLRPTLVAIFLVVAGVGFVLPNAPALALEHHGAHAGAASALLGCAQFLFGGLAAPLVGLGGDDSALPMATVMAALTVAALLTLIWCSRGQGERISDVSAQSGPRDELPRPHL